MRNITDFIYEAASMPLTQDEVEALTQYFTELTDQSEFVSNKSNNGTFAVYFPDRATLQAHRTSRVAPWEDNGQGLPHLTISKPARFKGGFAVTLYKKGRWAASEFPDPRRAFKADGTPKYATVDDLFALFDKNIRNGKWAADLGIIVK